MDHFWALGRNQFFIHVEYIKATMKQKKSPSHTREEKDSLGSIIVPQEAYWGAQTARSIVHFQIGQEKMPKELIFALVIIKKACAITNFQLKLLPEEKMRSICITCDEILSGKL